LLQGVKEFAATEGDEEAIAAEVCRRLDAALQLPVLAERFPLPRSRKYRAAVKMVQGHLGSEPGTWGTLLTWTLIHRLGRMARPEGWADLSRSWIDEWLLGKLVAGALRDLGLDEGAAWWAVGTIKILVEHQDWCPAAPAAKGQAYQVLEGWLQDGQVQQFLQVNRYRDVLWFNHEAFQKLLAWLLTVAAVEISADPGRTPEEVAQDIVRCYDVVKKLERAEQASGYQVANLLEAAQE
jgi:hypothetical protein